MLNTEIKKLMRRYEYRIMLAVMFIIVALDLLSKCRRFFGSGLSEVYPAYQLMLLEPAYMSRFSMYFAIFLPLLVGFMGLDSYVCDIREGLHACIMTRVSQKKYLKTKARAVFLLTTGTVFVVLFVSFVLILTAFPTYGYTLKRGQLPDIFIRQDMQKNYIMGNLMYKAPYMGCLFFMLMRSFYAGVMALFGFGVSVCLNHSRFAAIVMPFAVYTGAELTYLFAEQRFRIILPYVGTTYPLQTYPSVTVIRYVTPFLVYFGLFILTFRIGLRKEAL